MSHEDRSEFPRLPPDRMRLIHAVTLVIALCGVLLSWQAGRLDQEKAFNARRNEVQTQLADFRSRLETRIYSSLALARGLTASLVLNPDMGSENFARIAQELRMSDPYQLSVALAPGYRISEVYPGQAAHGLLALDLMQSPALKPSLLTAIKNDNAVLAGPWRMPDGQLGLTCVLPVWAERDGVPRLWGATALNLDFDEVLAAAGLELLQTELQLEIRGRDAMGPAGETFLGRGSRLDKEAVRVPVFVPGGSWLLSGMPRGGWQQHGWWATPAGMIGLFLSGFVSFAVFRILRDRLRIRTMAGVDSLTLLPNRRAALTRLSGLIHRGRRAETPFAVLAIDLDGFKPINDRHGHATGDAILAAVGQRLQQSVRAADTIARMGGDEFLLLVDGEMATTDAQLHSYAQRIRKALMEPIVVAGQSLSIGASIGIAAFPRHGREAEVLLREADLAMYRAKRDRSISVELAREPEPGIAP